MNITKIFSTLSLLILLFSCNDKTQTKKSNEEIPSTGTSKNDLDADIKYINRMREEIQDAETIPNDIETMRRISASDIVLMPESMQPIVGQENALNMMKEMWEAIDVKIEYHSEEVKVVGDIAIDRGWAKSTLKDKKTGTVTTGGTGTYLWISQRDKNGVWKQTHVIWNSRSE